MPGDSQLRLVCTYIPNRTSNGSVRLMEPRYSMTAYSVLVIASLGALSARGFTATAVAIALGVCGVGAALDASYLLRRKGDRALGHRRRLDRVVRLQWIGIGALGGCLSIAIGQVDPPPLAHAVAVVQTIVMGIAIASPTIYVSSLVDWYWVLPKVSGMVGPAPCERTGGEGFAGVTKVWLFHRAAATTVVTFVLAGVPGYMATTAGEGSEGAGWVILGSALAIGFNSVNNGLTLAFRYAFNPRLFVGDIVRVRANPEDAELKDAYVVDASIQGLKYKLIEDVATRDPCFRDKGELLPIDRIATTGRARDPGAPCPSVERCRAANWYCFRNCGAHDLKVSDASPPISWAPRDRSDQAIAGNA